MADVLGVGFAIHPDLDFLRIARPLIERDADYLEVNPETLWRPAADGLERNDFHYLFQDMQQASGKPFVAHGLGFSLGSELETTAERARADAWLERIRDDHETFRFEWLSEHLGWTERHGLQAVLPLPLPFTAQAASRVQARLRLLAQVVPDVLFENSANYFLLGPAMDEPAFLNALAAATPCGLVLDLHNVHTQALNLGLDPFEWIDRVDLAAVRQIHVSGGSESEPEWLASRRVFRLDSHDGAVPERVWELLAHALPACAALRGVVVERLNGTFDGGDVAPLASELQRVRELLPLAGSAPRTACPESPAELPEGDGLDELQDWLIEVLTGSGAAARLAARPDLAGIVDSDGFVLSGLLVRKLRFERLVGADGRAGAAFRSAPEAFAATFARYAEQVPATAWFPVEEAALFDAWCRSTGTSMDGGVEPAADADVDRKPHA